MTKKLYGKGACLLVSLTAPLEERLLRDGPLARQYMAERIFSDRSLLSDVESIVFPRVLSDFAHWAEEHGTKNGVPFVIMESAVFLEKPMLRNTADKVLTVTCPQEVRVQRVMTRSNLTREQVLARMANQWPDNRMTDRPVYVIG